MTDPNAFAGRQYSLRPQQRQILEYQRGWMGVSAVPGSGKTWTLSLLASEIISEGNLQEGQEVLVVTLVNSAVDNFSQRVRSFLSGQMILPMGFRVRTLHGLAHDIVRERPDLAGLDNQFNILDEREARKILEETARDWLAQHPHQLDDFLVDDDPGKLEIIRREKLPGLVQDIALQFIRTAKDRQLTPGVLIERMGGYEDALPLAKMGLELYQSYQQALNYRGVVDFDDLIRLALQALQSDSQYLERLRQRWPYILEDEAQDSSLLQEEILRLLSGPGGNWVRVGDPNQAIYETFTTADPRHLIDFLSMDTVIRRELPISGRSTPSIIRLANYLVEWVQAEYPHPEIRSALVSPPLILAAGEGDPQPNPPDDPAQIRVMAKRYTPQEEVKAVVASLERWLPQNPQATVAVLVPRNHRGYEFVTALGNAGISTLEMLQSTTQTRQAANALIQILQYLADPASVKKLVEVFRLWNRSERLNRDARDQLERWATVMRRITRLEDFISPGPERDWLAEIAVQAPAEILERLERFRRQVIRWQEACLLPPDQLLLTISQELFQEPANLALAYKMAALLRRASSDHPEWRLRDLINELVLISRNERKFLGFSQEDLGFNPDDHPGKVIVTTMHKAKGLEWDRVYLTSISNYDFPSDPEHDKFISERMFVRGKMNLPEETIAQLDSILSPDEWDWYQPGEATQKARVNYIKERLRLLYVGITRARKELVVTWNSGRYSDQVPALPFVAMQNFSERLVQDGA